MVLRYSDTRRRLSSGPLAIGLALCLLAGANPANAQEINAEALADACTSCHGIDGHSTGAIPSLAGVDKATLLSALMGFKSAKSDATIMNRIVRGYTDAELEALADYFSQVKSK